MIHFYRFRFSLWIPLVGVPLGETETHSESITLALYLHTLVSFTSPNTWTLLKARNLAALKPGMSQLCSNILGHLVQKGFFITLRVRRRRLDRVGVRPVIRIAFLSSAGGSPQRHMPHERRAEANFAESDYLAVGAAADFGKFLGESHNHVPHAHSLDASVAPPRGKPSARLSANAAGAQCARALAADPRGREIDENHHQPHKGDAVARSAGQPGSPIPLGAARISDESRIPDFYREHFASRNLRLSLSDPSRSFNSSFACAFFKAFPAPRARRAERSRNGTICWAGTRPGLTRRSTRTWRRSGCSCTICGAIAQSRS